jgi:stringent starvation protein B
MTTSTPAPTRPYLLRAIYEWINDNSFTPYLLINAEEKGVFVPQQYIKDGQIVLNIAPHAVQQLLMDNNAVGFSARFGGVPQQVYVPMRAIMGLHVKTVKVYSSIPMNMRPKQLMKPVQSSKKTRLNWLKYPL